MSWPEVLAIDIGGTKLAAAVAAGDGTLIGREQVSTPAHGEAEELFAALASLVDSVLAGRPGDPTVAAVGVGCGGPMARHGEHVSPLNITAWREFPLRARLAEHCGVEVHIDNDAKALALAEGWLGGAQGCDNYVAMVVSTGVGGGIVLDGRLLDGRLGNAGHIGHVVVDPNGAELPDHVPGSLEAECSGTAIAYHTGRPAAEASADVIEHTGRMVGQAVGSLANLLDLDLALVGGSVALGFGDPFFAAAQREIDRVAILDHSRGTIIRRVELGDEAPLVGAAAVAYRALGLDVGVS